MRTGAGAGIAAALAASAMYGFIPNLAGYGFRHGVPAVEAAFYRTSLIGLALTIAAIGLRRSFHVPPPARAPFAAMMASTFVISTAYLMAAQFIPVGLSVIVFFTFPLLILLTAPLLEGHAPGLAQSGLAALAFLGLAMAIGTDIQDLDPRGLALAGLAAAGAVLQFYSGRALGAHLDPMVTGGLAHLAIWPFTLAAALWYNGGVITSFPGGATAGAGYAAIAAVSIIYTAAFFAQMTSLKLAPASTVAPYYNLEPVVTTGVAAVLLGERLALNQYAGGAVVLGALIASSRHGKRT